MKRSWPRLAIILCLGALFLLLSSTPHLDAAPPTPQPYPDSPRMQSELLVGLRPNVVSVSALHGKTGAIVLQTIRGTHPVDRVRLPASADVNAAIATYRTDPRVLYVEPNYIAQALLPSPNDPSFNDGTQWALQKIQAPEAWALFPNTFYTAGSKPGNAIKVAVVDTGIDVNHGDFVNAGGTSSDASQGGQIDRADGFNLVNGTGDPSDDHGHGTHVAGILGAAANNGASYVVNGAPRGIVGVGYPAQIVPLKVLDASGFGSYSAIANGIIRAADRGAVVINLSLGGTAFSQTLQDAVTYAWRKGSVVIAAAGNNGGSTPFYPAACNFALGVGATTRSDGRASFSSAGNEVGIAAPGAEIFSTLPTNPPLSSGLPTLYGTLSGTSMAAPHVAGLAALYAAQHSITQSTAGGNVQIVRAIQQAADNVANTAFGGWSPEFGYGRINALKTLGGAPLRTALVGSIVGAVNDENNQVIAGAKVTVGGLTFTARADGTYRVANIAAGSYKVTASAPGHNFTPITVVVPPGADVNATFVAGVNVPPPPNVTPQPTPAPPAGGTPVSTWYFAEGSSQPGFSTFLLLENPNAIAINATVTYYREDSTTVVKSYFLPALARSSIFVNGEVPNAALAMKVESTSVMYAERAMYSGPDGSASHGIASLSRTWYFADGKTEAPFHTWLLLGNPNGSSAHVTLTFFKQSDGSSVVRTLSVAPTSRMNVYVDAIVPNEALSTILTSDLPIVAERSMFFGTGSHGSTGVTQLSTTWYLAEGFTGNGFDTYLLLANPNDTSTQATVTFMKDDGSQVVRTVGIPAHNRYNLHANLYVPNAAFGSKVTASQPIVVERSMYFGPPDARGGHNSEAAAQPSQVWNFPEGSTQPSFSTYLLVLNPNNSPAIVNLRILLATPPAMVQAYRVAPHSRMTIPVNTIVRGVAFSTIFTSDQPIVVERAMYFGVSGGTDALGIPAASAVQ